MSLTMFGTSTLTKVPPFPDVSIFSGIMVSADFSRFVVTVCPYGLALETSPVMDVFFPSHVCYIYTGCSV